MKVVKAFLKVLGFIAAISAVISIVFQNIEKCKKSSQPQKHGEYYKPRERNCGFYEKYVKRPLDCFLASFALVTLSPVMLVSSLLIRKKLGSPIIFQQTRPGRYENNFNLIKFRSMSNATDENGELLPDSERLTPFGKALRASSIDELPELINIVKGDMAIIGPRPLAEEYTPYYTEEEHHRHDVRPGLSGLAQISGRNALQWEDRFRHDLDYVDHISFMGDVKIIFQTVFKVFRHENVAVRGETQIKDFNVYRTEQWENGEIPKPQPVS